LPTHEIIQARIDLTFAGRGPSKKADKKSGKEQKSVEYQITITWQAKYIIMPK